MSRSSRKQFSTSYVAKHNDWITCCCFQIASLLPDVVTKRETPYTAYRIHVLVHDYINLPQISGHRGESGKEKEETAVKRDFVAGWLYSPLHAFMVPFAFITCRLFLFYRSLGVLMDNGHKRSASGAKCEQRKVTNQFFQ